MHLPDTRTLLMLGIRGMGMRGLAQLLHARGATILGADRNQEGLEFETDLREFDLSSESGALQVLDRVDGVIYSDAVPDDHPIRLEVSKKQIPNWPYQVALGNFAAHYRTVAVTGTHGKSTTTAFLAHILINAGLDPNVLIGAPMQNTESPYARTGESDLLIVEADEYRGHFLELSPSHAVITSIDHDHPDAFSDLADVENAFRLFLDRVDSSGVILTPRSVFDKHLVGNWPTQTQAIDIDTVLPPLVLPGRHMQHNAMLAIRMAGHLGVKQHESIHALETFSGLGRRFEHVGHIGQMQIISDYGHHPVEIKYTLEAARTRFEDQRILALFEAHTRERLRAFLDQFGSSFSAADGVLIAPVFEPTGRASTQQDSDVNVLMEMLNGQFNYVASFQNRDELPAILSSLSERFDVALAFSAGHLDGWLRDIVDH